MTKEAFLEISLHSRCAHFPSYRSKALCFEVSYRKFIVILPRIKLTERYNVSKKKNSFIHYAYNK